MKYQKKPIIVEAEQFWPDQYPWPDGVMRHKIASPTGYGITTLESRNGHYHVVTPGDWIITGVQGERYPCKPDIFEMTYELVRTE
jgi:hypothetical protein